MRKLRQTCRLLLGFAGGAALAAEEPALPGSAQGLDVAKREYEAIKAAGTPEAQQKLALPVAPSIELKTDELRLVAPSVGKDWLQQERERERAKKRTGAASPNWLLDAMDAAKTPPTQSAGAGGRGETGGGLTAATEPEDFLAQVDNLNREAGDRRHQDDERQRGARQLQQEAGNPLDRFMAGWMTPGDLALLVPRAESGPGQTTLPGAPVDGLGGLPAATLGIGEDPAPDSPRSLDNDARATNPYLAGLPDVALFKPESAVASLVPALPSPLPAGRPLPAPVANPELPPPPRNSPAEEFRKTQNDQKYFKQLKRF